MAKKSEQLAEPDETHSSAKWCSAYSDIETDTGGRGDGQTWIGYHRGRSGRRVLHQEGKGGITVIGDVEDFAIEADPPLAKRPGFIRAQVETFIRTEANQGETGEKSHRRESRAVESFGAQAHAGSETIAAKDICSVALVLDRKSTRLNSSHVKISYAVFCLKKK